MKVAPTELGVPSVHRGSRPIRVPTRPISVRAASGLQATPRRMYTLMRRIDSPLSTRRASAAGVR